MARYSRHLAHYRTRPELESPPKIVAGGLGTLRHDSRNQMTILGTDSKPGRHGVFPMTWNRSNVQKIRKQGMTACVFHPRVSDARRVDAIGFAAMTLPTSWKKSARTRKGGDLYFACSNVDEAWDLSRSIQLNGSGWWTHDSTREEELLNNPPW